MFEKSTTCGSLRPSDLSVTSQKNRLKGPGDLGPAASALDSRLATALMIMVFLPAWAPAWGQRDRKDEPWFLGTPRSSVSTSTRQPHRFRLLH